MFLSLIRTNKIFCKGTLDVVRVLIFRIKFLYIEIKTSNINCTSEFEQILSVAEGNTLFIQLQLLKHKIFLLHYLLIFQMHCWQNSAGDVRRIVIACSKVVSVRFDAYAYDTPLVE